MSSVLDSYEYNLEIDTLRAERGDLKKEVESLREQNAQLQARNAELERMLDLMQNGIYIRPLVEGEIL